MSEWMYKGLPIEIQFDPEISRAHLEDDLAVLDRAGFDWIVRERFIPWLKGADFTDRDDDKIFEGLKLYEILYNYGKIIAKYSPTGEENMFGQFEFSFESASEYTADMLEAVAMQVYILNGEIVKVGGYDI